jgi:hypothetical protein
MHFEKPTDFRLDIIEDRINKALSKKYNNLE